jgi:hypothetical protein
MVFYDVASTIHQSLPSAVPAPLAAPEGRPPAAAGTRTAVGRHPSTAAAAVAPPRAAVLRAAALRAAGPRAAAWGRRRSQVPASAARALACCERPRPCQAWAGAPDLAWPSPRGQRGLTPAAPRTAPSGPCRSCNWAWLSRWVCRRRHRGPGRCCSPRQRRVSKDPMVHRYIPELRRGLEDEEAPRTPLVTRNEGT